MAKLITGFMVLAVLLTATPVVAQSGEYQVEVDSITQPGANIKYLGKAKDKKSGLEVEGYQIVTKKNATATSAVTSNALTSNCYTFMAAGAKWKTVEDWIINPANNDGVDENSIFAQAMADTTKWEDATDGTLGNGGRQIFGNAYRTSATLSADNQTPDNVNEVYFGSLSDPNIIAVTTIWGVFSGPTKKRVLIEWDMVFNDDFGWAMDGSFDKMDFSNISTHELGHATGLGDLYNSCTAETMYGYAGYGEITKRTLNSGDITGTNLLY